MMKEISIEEIRKVEKILLPEGKSFIDANNERIEVIKEIDKNLDIVACPGSGKTTVLLAKLLILADRMPFEDGGGICVLTHTNVAIDEIKARLGNSSSKLFSYPNFFGTIQSFVDKYLAKPAFIKKFNYNIHRINNEKACSEIKYLYLKKRTYENTK
ncbi:MAG: UvrD-helicase domain-containing protein [Bacteroidales bacterium]|nr:UvrD-helicase domain-containing protein [Bacteroidales bacterium]